MNCYYPFEAEILLSERSIAPNRIYYAGDGNHDDIIDVLDIVRGKKWLAYPERYVSAFFSIDADCNGTLDAADIALMTYKILHF